MLSFNDDLWLLRQSYMAFRSLNYTLANQCGSESETLPYSLQICGFAICGLVHKGNLWICDLRLNHNKFADMGLRTGSPHKLADLRLRNEPKSLRIYDLWINKKIGLFQANLAWEFLND